ncbi:ATP synthase subunit I [Loktanella sp. DJP18]|uniref:N-ATPase subunit AtpR n=1 Tax=Loktanella sp. DJP18 TaxID=3409788 RepID=UPI003BB4BD28
MTDTLRLALTLLACLGGGTVIGYVYFRALHETARLIVAQGHPLIGLALTFGRLGLLCAGFYLAVLAGAVPLLAALVGVMTAKAIMVRTAP